MAHSSVKTSHVTRVVDYIGMPGAMIGQHLNFNFFSFRTNKCILFRMPKWILW